DGAYAVLFPALPAGIAVTVAKWLLASLLILPQSVLLGATFPLMSAGVLRRAPAAPGRTLSLLYFTNSLGAAAGVLVAGFWLLGAVGLPGTLLTAAAINDAVALGAWAVSAISAPAVSESAAPESAVSESAAPSPLIRALLLVAFGTAVASFVYEVA